MSELSVLVKFFASVREAAGIGACEVQLPEQSTVEDLLAVLRARFPPLNDALVGVGIALNKRYVSRDGLAQQRRRPGDEVALLPPISGG